MDVERGKREMGMKYSCQRREFMKLVLYPSVSRTSPRPSLHYPTSGWRIRGSQVSQWA